MDLRKVPDDLQIETHVDYIEARFLGDFSVERFNGQVDTAVQATRELKLSLLFVDVTRIQHIPTTIERYDIAMHGALAGAGLRKVAVHALPELVDPKKFGVMVARNRGLNVDVFTDRDKALEWLLAPKEK